MDKKVLIIDDDPDIHDVIKASLSKLNYRISSALDAMQGPMMARNVHPDLIILDIMMPAGGGLSVYKRLKQFNHTFQIPILIYSAVPPEQIQEKIPNVDRNTILTKPMSLPDLKEKVQQTIEDS